MRRPRQIRALSIVLLAALSGAGCKRSAPGDAIPAASASAAPVPELPPLAFRDDTPGALLTWVDDQGDFHVCEKTAEVPEPARGAVRVVLSDRADGTGESVYVADLRARGADGTYAVKVMSRRSWDELGAGKRKARLEALAPSAAPPAAPAPEGAGTHEGAAPSAQISAIIYGASWCGPCHQAEALLKSLGVKVTKKDIEESDAAQREMQEVLRKAHRRGGSIPVIDVMGQILVGFSDGALRAAVNRARGATL